MLKNFHEGKKGVFKCITQHNKVSYAVVIVSLNDKPVVENWLNYSRKLVLSFLLILKAAYRGNNLENQRRCPNKRYMLSEKCLFFFLIQLNRI